MMFRFATPLALLVAAVIAGSPVESADDGKKNADAKSTSFPKFDDVERTIATQLATSKEYKSGDLLTASSLGSVFNSLSELGWDVAERKELEQHFLPENDWLAKQFRSKKGRIFMRNIAKNPDGFNRLDRLRRMPGGERQVSELIQSPDGAKMIEYMTTTPGGKNLGRQLSNGKNGENFNSPTGRIYTEQQLLARLKQLHKIEQDRIANSERR